MRELQLDACAKLNLTLDILYRRPDGYHELEMVMQSISLRDTLSLRVETGQSGIRVTADVPGVPDGPENLAFKAAHAFFEATGLSEEGVSIAIQKRIPSQAGMAGGSSDAAAVLRGLRSLLAPRLSWQELEKIAAAVGSDVPFCVRGGTALAKGRGEVLTAWPGLGPCFIVVCKPAFGLSTPALFGRVRPERLENRPDQAALRRALEAQDLPGVARQLRNVFEDVLTDERAEIDGIRETLCRHGALGAAMTGSGPSVFGLFESRAAAEGAKAALEGRYAQVFLAQPQPALV